MYDLPPRKLLTARAVTREECPCLAADVPAGAAVYVYAGNTYGCVSPDGIAVTWANDTPPFFELPRCAMRDAASGRPLEVYDDA